MTEYTLTSPKWEGEIRLKYYENGYLASAETPEVIDKKSAEFLASHFPYHELIIDWYKVNTGVIITPIVANTSFESFWEAYNQKHGSKEKARQYWDGERLTLNKRPITLTDRQAIMSMVKKYTHRYQGEKKEWQPIATSFLNGRMWEAELENVPRKKEFDLLSLFK